MSELPVVPAARPIAPAKILWGVPFGRSVDPIVVKAFIRMAMGTDPADVVNLAADSGDVERLLKLVAATYAKDPDAITKDVVQSLIRLIVGGWSRTVEFVDVPYGATAAARNWMASYLKERKDATHLFMCDDDQVPPPDIIARLLRWWQEDNNKLVISAMNFRRTVPHDALVVVENPDGTGGALVPPFPESLFLLNGVCACGAMLIHREVVDRVPPPWFFVEPAADGISQTTEDYPFCRKVRRHGVGIWVDPNTVNPHLGLQLIDKTSLTTEILDMSKAQKSPAAMVQ